MRIVQSAVKWYNAFVKSGAETFGGKASVEGLIWGCDQLIGGVRDDCGEYQLFSDKYLKPPTR